MGQGKFSYVEAIDEPAARNLLRDHLQRNMEKNAVWLLHEAAYDLTVVEGCEHPLEAFVYQLVGFIDYKEEDQAAAWVEQGGMITREQCWAVPEEGFPKRTMVMITRLNPMESQPLVRRK